MIGILTYDAPHRKTQDLVFQLILEGNKDLILLILPFEKRKERQVLIKHRPEPLPVMPTTLAKRMNIEYKHTDWLDISLSFSDLSCLLIGGCGIVPKHICDAFTIINAHPGYLPYCRGLDALKWALLIDSPIGVTTHIIDENIDAGYLLQQKIVPIYYEDSFHSIAQRQYEMEISALVHSVRFCSYVFKKSEREKIIIPQNCPVHGRMNVIEEMRMLAFCNRRIKASFSMHLK